MQFVDYKSLYEVMSIAMVSARGGCSELPAAGSGPHSFLLELGGGLQG